MPELVDLLLVVSSLLLLSKQVVVLSLGELGWPVISAGRSDDHGLRDERHSRVGGHCGGGVDDVSLALGRERRTHAAVVVLGRSVIVEGERSDRLRVVLGRGWQVHREAVLLVPGCLHQDHVRTVLLRLVVEVVRRPSSRQILLLLQLHHGSTSVAVAHIELALAQVVEFGVGGSASRRVVAALLFVLRGRLHVWRSLLPEFWVGWLLSGQRRSELLLVVLNSPEARLGVRRHHVCWSDSVGGRRRHSCGDDRDACRLVVPASTTRHVVVVAPWRDSCHVHRLGPFGFLQAAVGLIGVPVSAFFGVLRCWRLAITEGLHLAGRVEELWGKDQVLVLRWCLVVLVTAEVIEMGIV